MPRDANGNYTLPAGNPVVTGTTISSTWANGTLTDIGTAMTDSLSRSGLGGMLAPFRNSSGSEVAPGITFGAETTTGLYLNALGDFRCTLQGADQWRVTVANFFEWSTDGGSTWKKPLPTVSPVVASGGLTVTAGGLTVSAGGANITGGLTVDGNSFTTGTIASMTGNANKLLTTNGTVNSWANSITGSAATDGFHFTAGSGNQNGVSGTGTGSGSGVAGTAGSGSGFGVGGVGVSGGLGGFFLSSAANVDAVRVDGYISLASATNPASTTGFANRLTPKNLVKAWVRAHCDGIGGVSATDGFNVGSVTLPGGNVVQVNFGTAMANTSYSVQVTMGPLSGSAYLGIASGAFATGSVQVQVINPSTLAVINPAATNVDFNVLVMATQ